MECRAGDSIYAQEIILEMIDEKGEIDGVPVKFTKLGGYPQRNAFEAAPGRHPWYLTTV